MRPAKLCLALALAWAACLPAAARDYSALQAEFWVDLDPMGKDGPRRVSREEAYKDLLEEARFVFSGMIYGFSFSYRPSDAARSSAERFELKPAGQIPWGDGDFEFREFRSDDGTLYLRIRYFPKEAEIRLLEAWADNRFFDAGGTGFGSYYAGNAGRADSIRESCKDAARTVARGLTRNKPSEVQGSLVFSGVPRTLVKAGQYRTECRVRVKMDDIEQYRNF